LCKRLDGATFEDLSDYYQRQDGSILVILANGVKFRFPTDEYTDYNTSTKYTSNDVYALFLDGCDYYGQGGNPMICAVSTNTVGKIRPVKDIQ